MAKYEQILTNKATGEKALIKSNDPYLLQQKKEKLIAKWIREDDKRQAANLKAEKADDAAQQTLDAKDRLYSYTKILDATLSKNDRIDWNELKDKSSFHVYKPDPRPTQESFFASVPKKSFFEAILPFLRTKRERAEGEALAKYDLALKMHGQLQERAAKEYEEARAAFLRKQRDHNEKVESTRTSFESGVCDAIEFYLNMVLERSEYPDDIDLDHDISFDPQSKTLTIETMLPAFDDFAFVSEVKYVASKDAFQTKSLSKTEAKEIYAEIIYQIAIRTLHEIYEAEYTGYVHLIDFNGYVCGIDPKRGTDVKISILKLKTDRDNFMQFNLSRVKAEACASGLGGKMEKVAFDLSSSKKIA